MAVPRTGDLSYHNLNCRFPHKKDELCIYNNWNEGHRNPLLNENNH